jgi:ketosteroid isomerase-like protein
LIEESAEARRVLDEAGVRRTVGHYFFCLDRRDFDGFGLVFTEDAIGEYGGEGSVIRRGLAEIVEGMRGVSQFSTTSHITSSQQILVEGDTASADTLCVCFNQTGDGATMLIRGVRYLDQLTRTPAGWRIARREHIPLWELRQPASAASYLRGAKPAAG